MNNEELKLLNIWAAEKVLETKSMYPNDCVWLSGIGIIPWDLTDARCREIVREYFGIQTYKHEEEYWYCDTSFDGANYTFGDSIEAAEIACINAIRLSEVE